MEIRYYKQYEQNMERATEKGPVRKVLEDLAKTYPKTFALVKTIFDGLVNGETDLETLKENDQFGKFKGNQLWEFRIPPKGKKGVFRGYCSIETILDNNEEKQIICLYSAEIKKNFKAEADHEKIDQAIQRYDLLHKSKQFIFK